MKNLHLDFESRSEVDIWEVGAWAYSVHPSTEILCLAWCVDDDAITNIPREGLNGDDLTWDNNVRWLKNYAVDGDHLFCAHNAFFEQCMWHNQLVPKLGWPRIPIKQWRCSQAKALASAYPQSLDKAAQALQSLHQKDKAGRQIMLKLCKPNSKGQWNEDPEDLQKLYAYCIDDVAAEREIDRILPDLNPTEQCYWFLDQLINQRGITIDKEAVLKALGFIDQYTKNLNNIVFQTSGAQLDRTTRRLAVLDWVRSLGVEIPGYTKADVKKVLEADDLPESVGIVLNAKLELGKTSVAKYQALANSAGEDNRIRDLLIYHGATTGRWTGKLFQLHNLPVGRNLKDKETAIKMLRNHDLETFELFYPDVMGTLSSCIRGMIIASPGCELFVGDYNAIEARVLFWLMGDDYGLGQYRADKDIYVDMAQRIYNCTTVDKSQRDLGKRAVLGCGYGMGAVKFAATCAQQGQTITDELAKRAVDAYRATYGVVVSGWYAQEHGAVTTLTSKQDTVVGRIRWQLHKNGTLICRLPSGRNLSYPGAFLEYTDTPWGERKLTVHYHAVDSKTKRWMVERTYGGKITENITQATARDILAHAMFACERAGYPIAFSVHDEIVADVPQGTGDLDRFQSLLCGIPKWADGCPIKAECWKGTRYKK